MIIVSITGPSMKEALAQVRSSDPHADAFEFRLDMIASPDITRLLHSSSRPSIVTCRPKWEGGKYKGTEEKRLRLLESAAAAGAHYIDVELDADGLFHRQFLDRREQTKVIISHHRFDAGAVPVRSLFRRMRATGADVIKLAYMARDVADNRFAVDFLGLAKNHGQNAVAIAMGEAGEPSRILYRKFEGWATYAEPLKGKGAAPGQLPVDEMKLLYQSHLRPNAVFGVVGYPLHQSKGVYVHNELFNRHSTNGSSRTRPGVYCRFPVRRLSSFFKYVVPWLDGFSVTIPHKQAVIKYLDELDPVSEAIGAVNTVIRRNGKLIGYNTDAPGALDAIEAVGKVKGSRMLIVGAGGAARAIVYEAKQRGAVVLVTNRTEKKARDLANEFGLEQVRMSEVRTARFDILVNATSVGMVPNVNASPVPKEILKGKIVFDAVYNPRMTKLLRDAESVGATIISGTEMYLNQAARQFLLYTGEKPDIQQMRTILHEHL